MLRLALMLLIAVAAALFVLWGAQSPGVVTIVWLGSRIETSVLFALIAMGAVLVVLLPVLHVLLDLGARSSFAAERARRRRGEDAMALGFLAIETGELREAGEHCTHAAKLIEEPRLAHLLRAKSAEARGDEAEAERLYTEMLSHADTELLGRKGLLDLALARGERTAALAHAEAALRLSQEAGWPALAAYELRAQAFDWVGALEALEIAAGRQAIGGEVAQRRRAALTAAAAAKLERERRLPEASDLALKAARLAPALTPAAILAARLLRAQGEAWKAVGVLEEAWTAEPHPAIAAAYRDVRAEASAAERLVSLESLARLRPEHRESRLLAAELAMERQDWSHAWDQLDAVYRVQPSSRVCGLFAALCRARGEDANAKQWVAQAVTAPREANWSDIDPDEPAFLYEDAEWRALVAEFGDRGRLFHARMERGAADAPFSAGFVSAAPASPQPVRLSSEPTEALRAKRVGDRSLPSG
jgi:HemY protein